MSARQSLYGQSLLRNASTINFGEGQEKHWKRDWYAPVKAAAALSATITPSGTPTPFGAERETPTTAQQSFTFQVKAWVVDLDYRPLVDGDASDFLDLEQFNTVKGERAAGLSDDAIRGAVGSESVIAGLSKSVDGANGYSETPQGKEGTPLSSDVTPKLESKEETPSESTVEPTPIEATEVEQDADGDVVI